MNQDVMGDDLLVPNFEANEDLVVQGRNIIENTLKTYLRTALPHLPEEGVEAITKFLTREELLAHVSFHIGTLDLVQSVVSFSCPTEYLFRKMSTRPLLTRCSMNAKCKLHLRSTELIAILRWCWQTMDTRRSLNFKRNFEYFEV